jgi:DNA repair exonuclease SbcCD ATPase subunit
LEFTHPDAKENDKDWLKNARSKTGFATLPLSTSYRPVEPPPPSDLEARFAKMDQVLSDMKKQLLQSELSRADMERAMAEKFSPSNDERLPKTHKMISDLNERLIESERKCEHLQSAVYKDTGFHEERLARTEQMLNDLSQQLVESEKKRKGMEQTVESLNNSNAALIKAVESLVAHYGTPLPSCRWHLSYVRYLC